MKKYDTATVQKIRHLRASGASYREINNRLDLLIPKSTLNYICKNVDPGEEYRKRVQFTSKQRLVFIRELAVRKNKEIFNKKLADIEVRARYVSILMRDKRVAKIALAMLYLGEGAKWPGTRGLKLGSSDPKIIIDYLNLLTFCFDIQWEKIRCRIQHRADQNSDDLLAFWSDALAIPKEHFYPCYVDRRTIGHKTKKCNYKGVCTIMCPGTSIQLELSIIADMIYKIWGISAVG